MLEKHTLQNSWTLPVCIELLEAHELCSLACAHRLCCWAAEPTQTKCAADEQPHVMQQNKRDREEGVVLVLHKQLYALN